MKKLEKLKLHNFKTICVDEQRTMIGGSYLYWSQETGWTNMLDEVTVTGSNPNSDWMINLETGAIAIAGVHGNLNNAFAEGTSSGSTTSAEWEHFAEAVGVFGVFALDLAVAIVFPGGPVMGPDVVNSTQDEGLYPREY